MDPFVAGATDSFNLDQWLLVLWGVASAALAVCLILSYCKLLRSRRDWTFQRVGDQDVWVSPDTGPAVIGVARSIVVLPEWILERGGEDQELVLAHETEHVRAGDPRLLMGVLLVLAALPWNPALWWQWRRLRQAVEIDCDLRVLARGLDPRAYSRLLVDVAERGTAHRLVVAALSESASFLERRIHLMFTPQPHRWWIRASGSALLASGLVLVACQVEQPSSPNLDRTRVVPAFEPKEPVVLTQTPATEPPVRQTRATNHAAIRAAIQRYYPTILTEGTKERRVLITFVSNSRGELERWHLEQAPSYPIGRNLSDMYQLFPGHNWHELRKTWRGTLERYVPPEMGPDTVFVSYAERRVEGQSTGPYRFINNLPGAPPRVVPAPAGRSDAQTIARVSAASNEVPEGP